MTLEVPDNLQYALLEFIAHINVQDYDSIPQDFINLGFTPEGVTADRLKSSGITEGLTFAFRQLSAGGGPAKIQERVKAEFQERYGDELSDQDLQKAARAEMLQRMEEQLASEGVDVKGVTNVMEEMSKRNRELFTLPPYVLYVARAFSTLEGIGLSVDENYAIVQECYPYLARRLFTDRSPRAKKALRAMLGLSEGGELEANSSALAVVQAGARGEHVPSVGGGALSPQKLMEMSDGFASYTAATANVDRDGAGQSAAAAEFAKLLFDPKGSTLQDILVEETARLGDAATRSALKASLVDSALAKAAMSALKTQKELLERSPLSNILPKQIKTALVDRPSEISELIEALLATTQEDEKILNTATGLRDALSSRMTNNDAADEDENDKAERISTPNTQLLNADAIRTLLADEKTRQLIMEQAPGVATLGRRLGAGLLRRAAYRTDNSGGLLPEETRKALSGANRRLAEAIDVTSE
jgi:aarF domain-containing kinase